MYAVRPPKNAIFRACLPINTLWRGAGVCYIREHVCLSTLYGAVQAFVTYENMSAYQHFMARYRRLLHTRTCLPINTLWRGAGVCYIREHVCLSTLYGAVQAFVTYENMSAYQHFMARCRRLLHTRTCLRSLGHV